jgi:hypothetical protein
MAFIFEIPRRAASDLFQPRAPTVLFPPMLAALLHFVPLFNFLAPVYMGLAFTHYGLAKLDELRNRTTP